MKKALVGIVSLIILFVSLISFVATRSGSGPMVSEFAIDEQGLATIHVDELPMDEFVRWYARLQNINLIAPTEIAGSVTVHLTKVNPEKAFADVLDSFGYVVTQRSRGLFYIVDQDYLLSMPVSVVGGETGVTVTVYGEIPVPGEMFCPFPEGASSLSLCRFVREADRVLGTADLERVRILRKRPDGNAEWLLVEVAEKEEVIPRMDQAVEDGDILFFSKREVLKR